MDRPILRTSLIEEFSLTGEIIQIDLAILKRFGELKQTLREQRELLPDADLFITTGA